jgi:hypothetical protein
LAGLAVSAINGGRRMKRIAVLTFAIFIMLCSCRNSEWNYIPAYQFMVSSYPPTPFTIIIDGYEYSSGNGAYIFTFVSGEEHSIMVDNYAPITINNQKNNAIFWIHPSDWVLVTKEDQILLATGIW